MNFSNIFLYSQLLQHHMLGIKVPYKAAELIKGKLISSNNYNKNYLPLKEKSTITFPILKNFKSKFEIIVWKNLNSKI